MGFCHLAWAIVVVCHSCLGTSTTAAFGCKNPRVSPGSSSSQEDALRPSLGLRGLKATFPGIFLALRSGFGADPSPEKWVPSRGEGWNSVLFRSQGKAAGPRKKPILPMANLQP